MTDIQLWDSLSKFQQWALIYFYNYENVERTASSLFLNSCLTSLEDVENENDAENGLRELVRLGLLTKYESGSDEYYKETERSRRFVNEFLKTLMDKLTSVDIQKISDETTLKSIQKIYKTSNESKMKKLVEFALSNIFILSAIPQLMSSNLFDSN